jgi:hypothetical protein
MEDREILLARSSEQDTSFISACVNSLYPQALPLLSGGLQVEREHDRHKTRISLLHPEERAEGEPQPLPAAAHAFLARYVSPAVLEVFPAWQGILIEVPALEGAVWVVHDPQYGRVLANETGKPAILLAAILAQQGRPLEETREALAPLLIIPAEERHIESPGVQRSKKYKRLTIQGDTAAKTAGAIHGNEGVGGCPRKGGKIQ